MSIIHQIIKFKNQNMLNTSNVPRWWLYKMYEKKILADLMYDPSEQV